MSQDKAYNKINIHVIHDTYGVYLLQSVPKPRSFYIGSTPNPYRRVRQHNGDLKNGGAYRTKKTGVRPWDMIVFVYNFTSKIAALQFEHSLQHPYQTRHITSEDRISSTRTCGNTLAHKLGNIRLLIKSKYFRKMDLKLLIFKESIFNEWKRNKFDIPNLDKVDVKMVNFETYFNKGNNDLKGLEYVRTPENDYFEQCKRVLFGLNTCFLCEGIIDYLLEDLIIKDYNEIERLKRDGTFVLLGICDACYCVAHLTCLAKGFLKHDTSSIIPTEGTCSKCRVKLSWRKVSKMATLLREYYLKSYIEPLM